MDDKAKTVKVLNPAFEGAMRTFAAAYLTPSTFLSVGSRQLAVTSKSGDDDGDSDYEAEDGDDLFVETLGEAEIVTSALTDSVQHMPVLDIDVPCEYIPSTNEGHGHLYFHKEIPWEKYLKLMRVMADCGLLEEGYVSASEARGYSAVRLPWITKGSDTFTGWVKFAGDDDSNAFLLPNFLQEVYDPATTLLVASSNIGSGSGSEIWGTLYDYDESMTSKQKMGLSGHFWYGSLSSYGGDGPKKEVLSGAKSGVINSAKNTVHSADHNPGGNYIPVIPCKKPAVVKKASSFPGTECKPVKVKKKSAPEILQTGDLFAIKKPVAKKTAVKKTAKFVDPPSPAVSAKTWSTSTEATALGKEKSPLVTVDSADGAKSTVIPEWVLAHPVDKMATKFYTFATTTVVTYSDGTMPLLLMGVDPATGKAQVEEAWTSTVSQANMGVGYEPVTVKAPKPTPADVKASEEFISYTGNGYTVDVPAHLIKPYSKVVFFDGNYTSKVYIFEKGWTNAKKFMASSKPGTKSPIIEWALAEPVSQLTGELIVDHLNDVHNTKYTKMTKTAQVKKTKTPAPAESHVYTSTGGKHSFEVSAEHWSPDCHVLMFVGIGLTQAVIFDKDWKKGWTIEKSTGATVWMEPVSINGTSSHKVIWNAAAKNGGSHGKWHILTEEW